MQGTEQQIAWAQDIRRATLPAAAELLANLDLAERYGYGPTDHTTRLRRVLSGLARVSDAASWTEAGQQLRGALLGARHDAALVLREIVGDYLVGGLGDYNLVCLRPLLAAAEAAGANGPVDADVPAEHESLPVYSQWISPLDNDGEEATALTLSPADRRTGPGWGELRAIGHVTVPYGYRVAESVTGEYRLYGPGYDESGLSAEDVVRGLLAYRLGAPYLYRSVRQD